MQYILDEAFVVLAYQILNLRLSSFFESDRTAMVASFETGTIPVDVNVFGKIEHFFVNLT